MEHTLLAKQPLNINDKPTTYLLATAVKSLIVDDKANKEHTYDVTQKHPAPLIAAPVNTSILEGSIA